MLLRVASWVVIATLPVVMGCSGKTAAHEAPTGSLGIVQRGDLCDMLSAPELSDLTGASFEASQVTPTRPGRDDGCFAASPSTGLAVTVEVWSEHGDLKDDLVRLGSPAATTSTSDETVAGFKALTASAEIDGRQMVDLAVRVDDRVLIVLVQRFSAMADGATTVDDLKIANDIADQLLTS